MPLFSIVTINKDNAKGLRKTLESIRAQSFRDFELLVIDGGSSDDSMSVVEEFTDIIGYCVSEPDRGIAHAFNKGTQAAKGELINYLNSGDYFLHDHVLETVGYSYRNSGSWSWGFGLAKRMGQDGVIYLARRNETKVYRYEDFKLGKKVINHQASFFRTSLVRELGYCDERFQFFAMDYDLLLRIAGLGRPREFNAYFVMFDTSGVGSSHFLKNLLAKHQSRVLRLGMGDFESAIDLVRVFVMYANGWLKQKIKVVIKQFQFARRLLRVDE